MIFLYSVICSHIAKYPFFGVRLEPNQGQWPPLGFVDTKALSEHPLGRSDNLQRRCDGVSDGKPLVCAHKPHPRDTQTDRRCQSEPLTYVIKLVLLPRKKPSYRIFKSRIRRLTWILQIKPYRQMIQSL